MTRMNIFLRGRSLLTLSLIAIVAVVSASCGGGGGGSEGAGRGLVLLSFSESGVDNVVLNKRLTFKFSEGVDAGTINNASIQLREGPSFGLTVAGTFTTQGSTVTFEPRLASLCDQSDSGFKPSTRYRVQLMGFPEEFAVRNMSGQALSSTQTYEFFTRADTDPAKYDDQIPGVGPAVLSSSPADGDAAVSVVDGNRIEILMSENLNPCTVNENTVLVDIYETGDPAVNAAAPNGNTSGFSSDGTNGGSAEDQMPGNYTTWGATGTTSHASSPRRVLCDIHVEQTFAETKIICIPQNEKFPENVMIVVRLTFDISDFGNLAMQPTAIKFTTENLAVSNSTYELENKGETLYDDSRSTAAIHPDPRAPERVQAYMLFAGDGDNGADQTLPSQPETPGSLCTLPRQPNNGLADEFEPLADVVLDTGATRNTCTNSTDGSTAVIWEFNSFRIPSGITVRIMGVNPAIILVQGDVLIENGGRLLVSGDGVGGTPRADGRNGVAQNVTTRPAGGVGVAGGGDGGTAQPGGVDPRYGEDGFAGLGSPDYDWTMSATGSGIGGEGTGLAGQPAEGNSTSPWDGTSGGGGGAGHVDAGLDGGRKSGTTWALRLAPRGFGGDAYERSGNSSDRLQMPEGGSGGGAAGNIQWNNSSSYSCSGGAGGAGGGFLDLTSSGDINILGTLDASGGNGGNGAVFNTYMASSGGGAGSGGALRLLTPNSVLFSPTTVVTAAGGLGGVGQAAGGSSGTINHGGSGGNGRIAIESSDSLVSNLASATVVPADGQPGFYRGQFDANRFQGGGLTPVALTLPITLGNHSGFNPTLVEPVVGDFDCGVPVAATPGAGKTCIVIEARCSQMLDDGTLDAGSTTDFVTVGHFTDSGVENAPNYVFGLPPALEWTPPTDNNGQEGFAALNALNGGGHEFIEIRMTFFLPATVGPFDAGSFLDNWTIRFTHDN